MLLGLIGYSGCCYWPSHIKIFRQLIITVFNRTEQLGGACTGTHHISSAYDQIQTDYYTIYFTINGTLIVNEPK